MKIERYGETRNWAVYDEDGVMICLTVYKKGASEVKRRMEELISLSRSETSTPIDQSSVQRIGAELVEENKTRGMATVNAR